MRASLFGIIIAGETSHKDSSAMFTNFLAALDMPLQLATQCDGLWFHLTAMFAYFHLVV